jgi:uncharacterized membrane protein
MTPFNKVHSGYRLIICFVISFACFLLLLPAQMETVTRIMICWDVFCVLIICWAAITFFTFTPKDIRWQARGQDASRLIIFSIVIIATLSSLVAIIILLRGKSGWLLNTDIETLIYISGILCSWILLHTIFTLRYAHLYYGDDPDSPEEHAGGLDVPGDSTPDYLDFAYFSFVIGMTFQVSDIQITSSKIRKFVLLHSLLSFLFNTVIVALSINALLSLH